MITASGLPTSLIWHGSFWTRGKLYIVNGLIALGSPSTITGSVSSTGTTRQITNGKLDLAISTWQDVGSFAVASYNNGVYLDKVMDTVYVVNGTTSASTTYNVQVGKINPSGAIKWISSIAGPPIISNDVYGLAMSDTHMYVGGGATLSDGSTDISGHIYGTKVTRATGGLGVWKDVTTLPLTGSGEASQKGMIGNKLFVCNGILFSIGGVITHTDTTQAYQQVYWARISGDGSVGAWNSLSFPDNIGRADMFGTVVGDLVYVAGGYNVTNGVDYPQIFKIKVDGGNGPKAPALVGGLSVARDSASMASDGSVLWVTGGENFAGTILSSIEAIKVK